MLIDFPFLNLPAIKKLFRIFDKYSIDARFVGGCVRDAIVGKTTCDFDIAINADIELVAEILSKEGAYCIKTGIKYGSIIVILDNTKFDITSLRLDTKCYGRDCDTEKTNDFYTDACRRDFTINAVYVDKYGNIFDYFGGIEDINSKQVRFIGESIQRIQEDYLRILRYYRFCSVMGDYSNRYSDIMLENAISLKKLPIERIQQELLKFIADRKIINIMYNTCVLTQIADVDIDTYNKLQSDNIATLLYSLFNYDALLNIFKLPCYLKKIIKLIYKFENENINYCMYKNGRDITNEIVMLRNAKYNSKISIPDSTNLQFPVTYHDLRPGIQYASRKLTACEKWWAENNFSKTKQECLDFIYSLPVT